MNIRSAKILNDAKHLRKMYCVIFVQQPRSVLFGLHAASVWVLLIIIIIIMITIIIIIIIKRIC